MMVQAYFLFTLSQAILFTIQTLLIIKNGGFLFGPSYIERPTE
jgi:hypothetical protein